MKRGLIIFLMLGLFIAPFVNAGVYFSNLDEVYNLGDIIEVDVSVDPIYEGHLVKVDLICNGDNVITFNNLPDSAGEVHIVLPLNFNTINDISGSCLFKGLYNKEERLSNAFDISNRLEILLNTDSFFAYPGEQIVVSGKVKRLNGATIDGEVEINVPLLELFKNDVSNFNEIEEKADDGNESKDGEVIDGNESVNEVVEEDLVVSAGTFYGRVNNGEFSVIIELKDKASAGDYRLDILAFEKTGDIRTSEGISIANLKIFHILTNVDIALSGQNFDPGSLLSFKPLLLDQTGNELIDEVSIIIRNDAGIRVFERIYESDNTIEYLIPGNLSSGYYELEASSGDINKIKSFYVNDKAIASFTLVNQTLVVKNIGNIPYKKDIQIELNGKPFVKKVNLALGEQISFKLTGTNGEYNVRVSDGENEVNQQGVMLTGRVIGVDSVTGKISVSPIIWIFLFIILAGGFVFFFRNLLFKKKSFAYPLAKKLIPFNKNKKAQISSSLEKVENPVHKRLDNKNQVEIRPPVVQGITKAEQVLVLHGEKSKAVVIAVKIKNKISGLSKNTLERAVSSCYDNRGVIYEQGDYLFVIFSPLLTKTFKNEGPSAGVAEKISRVIAEHNKKFKDKIEFGIAINSGEIINKVSGDKLQFTALGNTMVIAKRLAEASQGEVLVSKDAYEGGINEIKGNKKNINGTEVYEVKRVLDNTENKKFIDGFLKRMGNEKN